MEKRIKQLEKKIKELTKINEEYRKKFHRAEDKFEEIDRVCNLLINAVDNKNTKPSFVKNVADVFCLKGLFE